MFSELIPRASLTGLATLFPGAMLLLVIIQASGSVMDTVHPPNSSLCDHKKNNRQEKRLVIGIYRWEHEANGD